MKVFYTTMAAAGMLITAANAATILEFEASSLTNVNPSEPYIESDFTFTPENANSAIFAPTVGSMNDTGYFGFAGDNTITITATSDFALLSLDVGETFAGATDFTITGIRDGLDDLVYTVTGVTDVQTITLDWTGLSSVTIESSTDSGIDNVTVELVPEPSIALLMGLGTALAVCKRRRH